ncbi:kinase-like domain-containing protein [Cyathus striatus]|nr:kinase-like domain-containing protein [Cyathus striatus]
MTNRKLLETLSACDDNGRFHHLLVAWKEGDLIYVAEHNEYTVSETALSQLRGTVVPKNHIFPPWSATYTEALNPLSDGIYIKRLYGVSQYDGTSYFSELVSKEIDIMETISKSPHRNICVYYGYLRDGDYVDGIVLKKYPTTLDNLIKSISTEGIESETVPFIPDKIISGVRQGIDHIHSLELVHDDINPRNIMVDEDGEPIIIDFNSCVRPGEES